jgi:hypothetical protein
MLYGKTTSDSQESRVMLVLTVDLPTRVIIVSTDDPEEKTERQSTRKQHWKCSYVFVMTFYKLQLAVMQMLTNCDVT